jgi:hypothetical protein
MHSKALRIGLVVVGFALLALGLFHILGSFHFFGSSISDQAFTLIVPIHWLAVALAGAALCVVSFCVGKRKV